MTIWVYDIETMPNVFTLVAEDLHSDQRYIFEISERVNNVVELWEFLWACMQRGDTFPRVQQPTFRLAVHAVFHGHLFQRIMANCA